MCTPHYSDGSTPPIDLSPTRYIQMSGMAFGSMVEADSRIRQYEAHVRMQRRIARDRAMWQRFEDEYGKDDDDE